MLSEVIAYLEARLGEDGGATMVEYGLMVALVAVVALVGAGALGVQVDAVFTGIANTLAN